MWFPHIMHKDSDHTTGVEFQHYFHIIIGEAYIRRFISRYLCQICSGRFCQHVLDLYPPPRIKQPLQLCPVLPDERSELFQRHNIIFCFQAPLYKLFRCASECPVENVHNVFKMIVKCLTGNVTFPDQFCHCDLVYIFLVQHLSKGICNHCFHVFSHSQHLSCDAILLHLFPRNK